MSVRFKSVKPCRDSTLVSLVIPSEFARPAAAFFEGWEKSLTVSEIDDERTPLGIEAYWHKFT
jgi:hypothetical protein